MATKKKTAKATEVLRPFMTSVTIVAASPEELQREVNDLLQHFDLYDINNNTIVKDGKTQFIAFLYGHDRNEDSAEV